MKNLDLIDDDAVTFLSELDEQITVVILYPENEQYPSLVKKFEQTHAFLLHSSKMIVIDGAIVSEDWFTDDHLLVIQAHELGHYYLGHKVAGAIAQEKQADTVGVLILKDLHCDSAASLHQQLYHDRYGSHSLELSDEILVALNLFKECTNSKSRV